ncbi:helix-turn-helix transcriptional regulator [Microbacterium sp. 13-71-7]|uniref:helix-turn-helix domain-containing protein n=1 Tax=Microbacterium sp. 13-71-7 TaxID=1970399 RepID=UPI0025E33701|nr:helix-turn-helix transcriptional regulator [Microbacterium sp. 13-71-7]
MIPSFAIMSHLVGLVEITSEKWRMQDKGCRFLVMGSEDRVRGQDKGLTGLAIGQHVRRAREALGIDLATASERLASVGWPIAKSALSRLENGQRRVDVDDLMALSVALCASPTELLLGGGDAVVPTAVPKSLIDDEIRAWVAGYLTLDVGEIAQWWRNEIEIEQARLEGFEDSRAKLSDLGVQPQTLRSSDKLIGVTRARRDFAADRLKVVTAPGFDLGIPADPTTTILIPGDASNHGEHQAEA